MAKKKQSENVQNAYDAYASEVQNTGQDLVNGMTEAGQQQIADMEAANQAYNEANAKAMEANRLQSGAAIQSFADMVEGYARNIRQAEDESAAQVAADQRAARWTGATELASSIANLIAVGGHNAVSQQYRPYSQDWMRKADQDARLNRMRIDNLRERQRAMQGQLANMKLNDAAKALELARADAKAKHDQGLTMSQAKYNTTINPLAQAAKNAEAVGKINAQGAAQTADVALGEQRIAQSAAQHAASMRARGLNPDGSINEEAMGKLIAAEQAKKASKGSSGKDKSGRIPLMAYEGLPEEELFYDSQDDLRNAIISNIEGINDLTKEDRDKVQEILNDEKKTAQKKADELQRFLVKSGQMRSLFREKGMLRAKEEEEDMEEEQKDPGQADWIKPSERTMQDPSNDVDRKTRSYFQ